MTRYAMSAKLTGLIPLARERAVKGAELVASGKVRKLAGSLWLVQGTGDTYIVDLAAGTCDCPDGKAPHDEQGRKWCKHYAGAWLAAGE